MSTRPTPAERGGSPDTDWKEVLQGQDDDGRTVSLIKADTPALRRMAVFDVLVNNADRKGDHLLAMGDGHRYGVDHGLTFHSEHKLRAVLSGRIGAALSAACVDRSGVGCRMRRSVLEGLQGALGRQLAGLPTYEEVASLAMRWARLCSSGRFPAPSGEMATVTWQCSRELPLVLDRRVKQKR